MINFIKRYGLGILVAAFLFHSGCTDKADASPFYPLPVLFEDGRGTSINGHPFCIPSGLCQRDPGEGIGSRCTRRAFRLEYRLDSNWDGDWPMIYIKCIASTHES